MNQAAILAAIENLGTQLNNRIDNLEIIIRNSSAHAEDDSISTPHGHGNPPPYLPTTVSQLRTLTPARVQELENYFQLPPLVGMDIRRKRLKRLYVGITRHVVPGTPTTVIQDV